MQKNLAIILDIGSSKVTVMAGERGVNNTFILKGYAEKEYSGFYDGEFIDGVEFEIAVKECLETIEDNLSDKVSTIYVGVPGEFTIAVVKEARISYKKPKKIGESELNELFDIGFENTSTRYTVINRSGIYFTLDDMRRVADPVGERSSVLNGKISYVLCENSFIDAVAPCLKSYGVNNIEFTSSALAEALYLFEPEQRDRLALLVDCGYLTTSLSLIEGDGIVHQKSFALGGGTLSAYIMEEFDVSLEVAERLKRRVNLACNEEVEENYCVIDGDKEYFFELKKVNALARKFLDELAESIDVCLTDVKNDLPGYVKVSLTGGGVSLLRGAKEHLSGRINMVVETIAPDLTHINKPTDSSKVALLDLALNQKPIKSSLLAKIFGKI